MQYLLEWVLEQLESEEIFPVFSWPYEDEKERPSYGGVDALGVSRYRQKKHDVEI